MMKVLMFRDPTQSESIPVPNMSLVSEDRVDTKL